MDVRKWLEQNSSNALFWIVLFFFARARISPQWELAWLMTWYWADWLHGRIPWKKGWGTDEVCPGGPITATSDRLHFQTPVPMDWTPILLHTLQAEQAKGRVEHTFFFFLLLCLMGNLGVSWSWTVFSYEVSVTIVFCHGRAADWGVTYGAYHSVSTGT